jgi:hypothetical protein
VLEIAVMSRVYRGCGTVDKRGSGLLLSICASPMSQVGLPLVDPPSLMLAGDVVV